MAPTLTRGAWVGGALLAAATIVGLAAHGRRPDPGLVRFEPGGLLREHASTEASAIEVSAGPQRWRFERSSTRTWHLVTGPGSSATAAEAITQGLRFLAVTPPQRVLSAQEVREANAGDFGLDPPRYSVAIHAARGAPFIVHFGGPNAQGLAQYARLDGRDEVVLLPRYVGEPWEAALALP